MKISTECCPNGTTMKAASNGPSDCPKLPPTWNRLCANPCRPPEAARATRDASGWKTALPMPDHRDRDQQHRIGLCESEQNQTDQREGHAGRQNEIHRPPVQAHPDHRLKERGGELEDERDEPDLEEAQRESLAEHRIERRRERLHHVVEHVRGAERDQDAERRRPHFATLVAEASAYVGAVVTALSPGGALLDAPARKSGRQRGLMSGSRRVIALRPALSIRDGYFRLGRSKGRDAVAISAPAPWSSGGLPSAARPRPWRSARFRSSRAAGA